MQRNALHLPPVTVPPRWDIFCAVIDNFGDIGVAWRLARQLAAEHGLRVRLWVDDLAAFARIWPEIDPAQDEQTCAGVEVRRWARAFGTVDAAGVVIEAFGCTLPDGYLEAMAARPVKPVWINLEYLTAEAWAGAHHGLPSPHPRLPLTKHFFFPGYRADTGGLLREAALLERAAGLQAAPESYWRGLGVDPAARHVSLFAYDNPALPALFALWTASAEPVVCLVPDGKILPRVAAWFGEAELTAGQSRTRGNLGVVVLPFMRQDEYDRLLWACDVNFVRGEDSCVRAQWAGRPFVWQAYPQAEDAHRDKLCALFGLMSTDWPPSLRDALHALWLAWNGFAEPGQAAQAWRALDPDAWRERAAAWRDALAAQADLARRLADFVREKQGNEIAGEIG